MARLNVIRFAALLAVFLLVVPHVAAESNVPSSQLIKVWKERNRATLFSVDEKMAEGRWALETGDFQDALNLYSDAYRVIDESTTLSELEKNRKKLEIDKQRLIAARNLEREDLVTKYEDEINDLKSKTKSEGITLSDICPFIDLFYGSPLMGAVQTVRDFRDNSFMKSYTGSQFMPELNGFYYSSGPHIIGFMRENPFVRPFAKVAASPILVLIILSGQIYSILSFSPEAAAVAALIAGSVLFAVFYLVPVVFLLLACLDGKGRRIPPVSSLAPLAVVWSSIIGIVLIGNVLTVDLLTAAGSVLLLIITLLLATGFIALTTWHLMIAENQPVP
jgi:hypothetical protein